ncbi:MAG: hypothetical protein QNJ00_15640 [Woeseiaceae bacterium]|nr:hypothetical protein [Woeseiaceae bacterium]
MKVRPFALTLLALLSHSVYGQPLSVLASLDPAAEGTWRVTYEMSRPVSALVFLRSRGDYRRASWTMYGEFVLDRIGQADRIRRRDDEPFDVVIAGLDPWSSNLEKEYTPFLRFSDGSVAMFTGQFTVGEPTTADAADFGDGADDMNTQFPGVGTLILAPGDYGQMIVDAEITQGAAHVTLGEGEYVYYGGADAIDTQTLTAVTDAAAPAWLREHLYESMAVTFDYYTRRLGPLPGEKPFMLTSYESLEGGRISFGGGVIGSQVAIQMGLGEKVEDNVDNRRFMARFFAHESAHLWNNYRAVPDDGSYAWIHEGSAEAIAWLTLNHLGLDDPEAVRALFEDSANECIESLPAGPLNDAGRRGDYGAYYVCGATISLATHALMRARGQDLFDFWRELIEISEASNGTYTEARYDAFLHELSPDVATRVRAISREHIRDGYAAVSTLLERSGVETSRNGDGKLEIAAMP